MSQQLQWLPAGLCIAAALCMMACMRMMQQARRLRAVHRHFTGRRGGRVPRIALLSDLHLRHLPIPWEHIYEVLRSEQPELILVTGDIINAAGEIERALSFVKLLVLNVRVPVYITFGNHENELFHAYPEQRSVYAMQLKALSPLVHVLDDTCAMADGILIGGLNDVSAARDADKPAPAALVAEWGKMAEERRCPFLLATHNADMLLQLEGLDEAQRPDLTVCGHTHGGQIRMPLNFEFRVLRKDILPKSGILYGVHVYKGMPLYITSGLGCALLPMRLGSCAEIVLFDDGAAENA